MLICHFMHMQAYEKDLQNAAVLCQEYSCRFHVSNLKKTYWIRARSMCAFTSLILHMPCYQE